MIEQSEFFSSYQIRKGNRVITTFYDPRRKKWRLIKNGRETFYDPETNEMLEWPTEQDAIDWIEEK